MKTIIIGLLLAVFFISSCTEEKVEPITWNHDLFDALLTQYVDVKGDVNYAGFKTDQSKLEAYLDVLKENTPDPTWSDNKQMAYWINLYNAFTIYNILLEYPVNSILDIDNGMIWSQRTITIDNNSYTLDQIEQNQLLTAFSEAKVHFAVNCAAASCPPLLNKVWTEATVQQYYDDAARNFINDTTYNFISADSIAISEIFNWYATDFGGSNQIVTYLQQYADTTISNNATVTYKTYNWILNEQ